MTHCIDDNGYRVVFRPGAGWYDYETGLRVEDYRLLADLYRRYPAPAPDWDTATLTLTRRRRRA